MHESRTAAFAAGALLGGVAGASALYLLHKSGAPGASSHASSGGAGPGPSSAAAAAAAVAAAAAAGAGGRPGAPHGARQQQRPQQQHGLADFDADDILSEQLTRNVQFFGLEPQRRIARAFVVVVGLGGVGSHAAHMLLRSGVGRLRLVDFDQVTLSSLNRHAVATRADVGTPKVACMERHFRDILPEADIECLNIMCTEETLDQVLAGSPDYVFDAIDNIDTKVALLAACKERGIPVLCSAGAGAKADPTRLRIVDISESSVDPLARAVRQKLGRRRGVRGGIPVLMSTEKPRCELVATEQMQAGNPLDFQIVPNFRVRTIPVLGPTPALFGMAAASYILCQLAGAPYEGEPILLLTQLQYDRAMERLIAREESAFGSADGVAVDRDDIIYLLRELWRGFSARAERVVMPGGNRGLMRSTADLTFVRWDRSKPATVDNLVLLTQEEADAHEAADLAVLRREEPDLVAFVEGMLARARYEYCGQRDAAAAWAARPAPGAAAVAAVAAGQPR